MKSFFLLFLTSICFLISCEEVVDIDLPEEEPRLVIDANIQWEKGTSGASQSVLLSTSTPFYNTDFVPVTNAQVVIQNTNTLEEFTFVHTANGLYETNAFVPVINDEYKLNILHNGEEYEAIESLVPVTDISRIEQSRVDGISGDDVVNIEVFTNDIANKENYFYFEFNLANELPNLLVYDDEFQDGNEIGFIYRRVFFGLDDFVVGDQVNMVYQGISKSFFNYMELLLEQSETAGDPFASVPVQLNGNGNNLTSPSRKPYGFFRLGEIEREQITIQ